MLVTILKTLSLGIWLGAIIMLGIMAGTVFHLAPSRTLAGMLIGAVIAKMNILEWVCAAIALLSSAWLLVHNWNGARKWRIVEFGGILLATALLWYYSMVVNPHLNDLRQQIGDFDHPQATPAYVQARDEFDAGHKLSSTLVQINMIVILGSFMLSIVNLRRAS